MKLTTKGRYAVTAMLDIALHQAAGPVSLCAIAQRQRISQTYLEQLSTRLRRAGLLASVRGPAGGYYLDRKADDISVGDIIMAINEEMDSTRCQGAENCDQGLPCLTHQLWEDLNTTIHQFLANISLVDLMNKPQVKNTALRQDKLTDKGDYFIAKTTITTRSL